MEIEFLFTTALLFMIGVMHAMAVDPNSELACVLDSQNGNDGVTGNTKCS